MSYKPHETYDSIILSGGGTKGFCTLGALQYMYDNFLIKEDNKYFIGTSIGSIISYLLAIGYKPIEIVVYLCSNNVFELLLTNFSNTLWSGIYDYSIISKHCETMTLNKLNYIPTLKELKEILKKELIICSYNLTKHKREYISYLNYPNLSCIDAIRMSSSIPFIFNECIYNNDEYIDGGVIDNFPINILSTDDEKFKNISPIGINLGDYNTSDIIEEENTNYNKIIKLINKLYNIIMIPNKEKKEYQISIDTIEIKTEIKFYNFSISHTRKLELFSYGYNCAKHYFDNKILTDTLFLRNI
jgi:NTE family protein